MEIIESEKFQMRDFFDAWHTRIFDSTNGYQIQYYDNCHTDFIIRSYASNGFATHEWVLKECYPVAVNSSQMSWASTNQHLVIPIELAFHEWTSRDLGVLDQGSTLIRGAVAAATSTLIGP